MSKKNMVHTVM